MLLFVFLISYLQISLIFLKKISLWLWYIDWRVLIRLITCQDCILSELWGKKTLIELVVSKRISLVRLFWIPAVHHVKTWYFRSQFEGVLTILISTMIDGCCEIWPLCPKYAITKSYLEMKWSCPKRNSNKIINVLTKSLWKSGSLQIKHIYYSIDKE